MVVVAAGVVVFGAVIVDEAAGAIVFAVSVVAAPDAGVEPPLLLPVEGVVDVAGGVGSVFIGVGTGGNGLDRTLAISSFRPASDLLRNL